jgi:outer membrane receptor for monomeric catechols
MAVETLRTIIAVACCCSGAFAVAGERPRHAPTSVHGLAVSSWSTGTSKAHLRASRWKANAPKLAADRDPYADPAAPYKANRLSWSRQPILNIPGQTIVLTRQILDDTNATSLSKALGSAAGVTVGR